MHTYVTGLFDQGGRNEDLFQDSNDDLKADPNSNFPDIPEEGTCTL